MKYFLYDARKFETFDNFDEFLTRAKNWYAATSRTNSYGYSYSQLDVIRSGNYESLFKSRRWQGSLTIKDIQEKLNNWRMEIEEKTGFTLKEVKAENEFKQ